MKYVVILGDGMADWPIDELGGKTPLEYAKTPMMDTLVKKGTIGMVQTVPAGMKPGSDTANLSVLGYDPRKCYTGRSSLEALSIGVPMKDTDVAIRCNLVTLSEEEDSYEERRILDHSADEISTEEAKELLEAVRQEFEKEPFHFYTGTSFRHLLIWDHGPRIKESSLDFVQPHDILGQVIGSKLPKDKAFRDMMIRGYDILENHPINLERKKRGLKPGNSLWFWGAGTKPSLDSFDEKNGIRGAMISAVDLLKGIAIGASMKSIDVEGATGNLDTNYEGKAAAGVSALAEDDYDYVYIHVEATDEMGHQGKLDEKILGIENLDQRVIRPVYEGLVQAGLPFRMLILPDHPTPIAVRTHVAEPVPYLLYDSTNIQDHSWHYNEREGKKSDIMFAEGYKILDYFLKGDMA